MIWTLILLVNQKCSLPINTNISKFTHTPGARLLRRLSQPKFQIFQIIFEKKEEGSARKIINFS